MHKREVGEHGQHVRLGLQQADGRILDQGESVAVDAMYCPYAGGEVSHQGTNCVQLGSLIGLPAHWLSQREGIRQIARDAVDGLLSQYGIHVSLHVLLKRPRRLSAPSLLCLHDLSQPGT